MGALYPSTHSAANHEVTSATFMLTKSVKRGTSQLPAKADGRVVLAWFTPFRL